MGFGLDIGFIDHVQVVTTRTNNYKTIDNFHTFQITGVFAIYFPACSVFAGSYLVMASTNGCASASRLKSSMNTAFFHLPVATNSQAVCRFMPSS
jgi:hypothetical protein